MSRFLQGFSEDSARSNSAPVFTTGGTTTGIINTSATPTGNAVITKSQADALVSGGGGLTTNGMYVQSVIAGQVSATAQYSFSSTTTCNWTVPSGVTRVFIQVWGGGGGGGGPSCKQTSAPGGAGGYSHGRFTVVAGDILCIQAGRGGCRGCCARHGCSGVISYVCNATRGIQIRSYPGSGGLCNMSNYGGSGGAPGVGAGSDLNICGQRGMPDAFCACQKYDYRQKAMTTGVGPQSFGGFLVPQAGNTSGFCTNPLCGMNNASPGGGGAGSAVGYPTSQKGGNGGPGLVMIWY